VKLNAKKVLLALCAKLRRNFIFQVRSSTN
jgi:hypothetical protein